jgi:TolB-like protein/DNA-binding winged helix-turn-helix (wHTH) protein
MDAPVSGERLVFGSFCLEPGAGRLSRRGAAGDWLPVPIGSRALDILRILLKAPGEVVSKDAIMDAVWPGVAVEPNNLTVQIAALRRVLDQGCNGDSCIQTVPGRGYRLDVGMSATEAPTGPPPEPTAAPVAPRRATPQSSRPVWRWPTAAAGAIAVVALLLAAAWAAGWFSGVPAQRRLSIVVLPFTNLSGDRNDDYLADAVTDDLTGDLAHIAGAFVISHATAYTYRSKAVDIRTIGSDLNVRYVVRGSMQRLGQVLRVNVELGSTETGALLWSDRFDKKIDDLAAGQEQIVIRMRSALNISLADIEASRSLRERPTNPDAFDLILQARVINLLPQTKETAIRALRLYEQALVRDPNAVLALTGATSTALNAFFYDAMPYETAMGQALQYLERARSLEPNAESVLSAQSDVLDFRQQELNYRRMRAELSAVGQRLIDLYPNNVFGYFHLGVLARNEGRYDDGARYFAQAIRLNPRSAGIKNAYWNMTYCTIGAGHDQEGLGWADRTIGAEGSLPLGRSEFLSVLRIVAYARTGDLDTARRLAKELNDHNPFGTWRMFSPDDPASETGRQQTESFRGALRAAGLRDHLDADVDFGVVPDDVLHTEFQARTPTTAPGVTTLRTEQLADMLQGKRPLVIDTMSATWYRSIPGAFGLDFHGNTHGTFTDDVQKRLEQKLRELTGGDTAKPIVAVGWDSASFDGYNLALRIRHAGYTNVYWYRGGREAWEVAGKPEDVVRPSDW